MRSASVKRRTILKNISSLEGDYSPLIVEIIRCGGSPLWPGGGGRRLRLLRGSFIASLTPAPAIGQELHVLSHDLELTSFLSSILIIPGVHLKTTFNIHGPTLTKILLGELSLPRPQGNIDESCLFYPCLLYTSPSPRDATLSRMPSSA